MGEGCFRVFKNPLWDSDKRNTLFRRAENVFELTNIVFDEPNMVFDNIRSIIAKHKSFSDNLKQLYLEPNDGFLEYVWLLLLSTRQLV